MVRAHRQAWTWQDEWFGLTMEDIRELERQTQVALAQKMGSASGANGGSNAAISSAVPASGSDVEEGNKSNATTTLSTIPGVPSQPMLSPVNPPTSLWPISCISESSSDDDEFFDCQGS